MFPRPGFAIVAREAEDQRVTKARQRLKALTWAVVSLAGTGAAAAQSNPWDAVISNTSWYVTVPQMLAYASSSTSFANPIPIGDQTLWVLGSSTDGIFTGTSTGELAIGSAVSISTMTIQGTVTPAGQITMVFTPTSGGATTIGLGQMADVGGVYEMEMQMITGTSLLVTHWAYMVPYDPATFTPPSPQVVPSNASPQWAWTQGTPWRVTSAGLFGSTASGTLVITNYKSGYFWGAMVAPGGTSYTVLGSITPEGRVLLNTLDNGQLTSLYGSVEGDPSAAAMLLGTYTSSAIYTGDITALSLVRPYADTVAALGNPAGIGAATSLYGVAGTLEGLFGPLAPALEVLNGLKGPALATAVSQTLPVLSGAGAQATYATQRALQQLIMQRLDVTYGPDAPGPERSAWLRPFGAFAHQGAVGGVTGYSSSGGGVAAGIDAAPAPDLVLGGVAAYSYSALTGGDDLVPNSLDISSYQLGLYGSYEPAPGLKLDLQLDGGYNHNSESRTLAFMGATASASYEGWTGHAGLGVSRRFEVAPGLTLSPLARIDYAQVDADGYQESGAGALDLSVGHQTYRELLLTGGVKASYQLGDSLRLSAHGEVGYNTLDNQVQITAAFAGGGTAFVTTGPDLSPWLYTAGVSLSGLNTERLDLALSYDVEASTSGFLDQIGSVRLKMTF